MLCTINCIQQMAYLLGAALMRRAILRVSTLFAAAVVGGVVVPPLRVFRNQAQTAAERLVLCTEN